MGAYVDQTGMRFGRLTVIRRDGYKGSRTAWLCQCDCGNSITVTSNCLNRGHTRSCGCLRKEMIASRAKKAGDARGEQLLKHGKAGTRLYNIWKSMRARCNCAHNSDYSEYGGRGIKICPEWDDFSNFHEWAVSTGYDETAIYGKCTIDRIDVNGDYEPSNCRWVSLKIQANNRRIRRWKRRPA